MTPASKPSAAPLRYAAPVSDALYAVNERGPDCAPIRGEDPAPIDTLAGDILKLLALPGNKVPASFESSVKVVAGARFDRDLKCKC